MKKLLVCLISFMMLMALSACSDQKQENGAIVYKIGICNYVDDASLNQIIANIKEQLKSLETDAVKFEIDEQNCNADAAVLEQIISNFINDNVDLMVGVATPVAIAMQAATEDNQIPVVFAAVSDPVGCQIVSDLNNIDGNITGTSDYLDTKAIMNLIKALDNDVKEIGLLYDKGQDSSTTAILEAKQFLDSNGIKYKEYNATNTSEVQLAVASIIQDRIEYVFTPSDNTIMTAELSIYEDLAANNIKHFAGADSFALNGAFVGYGVDYANLGKETANSIYDVLVNNNGSVKNTPVKTFDNGIVTINSDVCAELGLDMQDVKDAFVPLSTAQKEIKTAESFE